MAARADSRLALPGGPIAGTLPRLWHIV